MAEEKTTTENEETTVSEETKEEETIEKDEVKEEVKKEEKKSEAKKEKKSEAKEEKKSPKKAKKSGATLSKDEIVEAVQNMSALELSELVSELEEIFGVSAAMPMASAAVPVAGAETAADEEKSTFDVILKSAGDKKIQVIKVVRSVTSLGLKEAKDLVDSAPKPVVEGVNKDEAEKVKGELEEVGAEVELQ